MLRLWTLFLIVIVWMVAFSESCNCPPSHPQDHYCESDFVILATPKSTGELFDNIIAFYSIHIDKILKASAAAMVALKKNLVYTPINLNKCHVSLEMNKKYLLIGKFNGNNLEITDCEYHKEWSFVPKIQKTFFEGGYNASCSSPCVICTIGPYCGVTYETCGTDIKGSDNSNYNCYALYGNCHRELYNKPAINETLPDEICTWQTNKDLTKCLRILSLQRNKNGMWNNVKQPKLV